MVNPNSKNLQVLTGYCYCQSINMSQPQTVQQYFCLQLKSQHCADRCINLNDHLHKITNALIGS